MSQEGWPFENTIRGVVTRDGIGGDDEPQYPDGTEANDVFIVEGAQERYGSKAAWSLV